MDYLTFMLQKVFLVLFVLSFNCSIGQVDSTWYSIKNKIVIPFEFSNNLIFLDVLINNVTLKVILDTGTEKNILFSFPNNDTIELFNPIKTKISGVGNGNSVDALISSNNKLKINDFENNNFEVLILNENNVDFISKLGKEVHGIIGYSFFKDRLVEIDYVKKKITIHKNRDDLNKRKRKKFTQQKIELINNKPYLKINSKLNDKLLSLNLLFDTGLSDGLWLFENDLLNIPNVFIEDYLGFGLAGEIHGKRARIDEIQLSNFTFNEVLVSYPNSLAFNNIKLINNRNGSIGGEIIKRFHLYIDYKNEIIYLKRNSFFNDSFNYNMSGLEVQHAGIQFVKEEIRSNEARTEVNLTEFIKDNSEFRYNYKFTLKPIFIISSIRKNSAAANAGLLPNDKIISINNRKAHDFTIQKINELFQSEDGKIIKMEVERDDKIIKVEFYLKKII